MNKFDQLVEDIVNGELTISHIEMAYRESIRRKTTMSEGVKNLLVGKEGAGLVKFASHIGEIVGNMELSYLRGRQGGIDGDDLPRMIKTKTKKGR